MFPVDRDKKLEPEGFEKPELTTCDVFASKENSVIDEKEAKKQKARQEGLKPDQIEDRFRKLRARQAAARKVSSKHVETYKPKKTRGIEEQLAQKEAQEARAFEQKLLEEDLKKQTSKKYKKKRVKIKSKRSSQMSQPISKQVSYDRQQR